MTTIARTITGGVDTHLDVHVAAALDERGALLGVESFSETTPRVTEPSPVGLHTFGSVELIGIEGTGSYGAGLTRHLLDPQGLAVVEVGSPSRAPSTPPPQGQVRPRGRHGRRYHAAQGGDANGAAKTRDGNVEAMRVLRVSALIGQAKPDPGHQPDAQPHLDLS